MKKANCTRKKTQKREFYLNFKIILYLSVYRFTPFCKRNAKNSFLRVESRFFSGYANPALFAVFSERNVYETDKLDNLVQLFRGWAEHI